METRINEIWSKIQAEADRAITYARHPSFSQLCDAARLTKAEKAFAEAYKALEDETI